MIAYVQGPLVEKEPTHVVVACGGVGYHVRISLNTYSAVQPLAEARLYTHFQVKEDGQTLFGFYDRAEKHLFEQLITVNGVGGNTALLLLSSHKPTELQTAIAREDVALLKRVKGIGQKTAERIVLELKGKMNLGQGLTGVLGTAAKASVREEALAALQNLGFARNLVEKRVDEALRTDPAASLEAVIKAGLKG